MSSHRSTYTAECSAFLLALLNCYKTYNFARGKCEIEEKALMECSAKTVSKNSRQRLGPYPTTSVSHFVIANAIKNNLSHILSQVGFKNMTSKLKRV